MHNAQKWYIETPQLTGEGLSPIADAVEHAASPSFLCGPNSPTTPEQGLPVSCSFVEFDERGDHLDFHQHRHAYEKVLALAQQNEHLIVVMFLHGWRNNGQSRNVVEFNEFLQQLATHSDVEGPHHRVHGIYLSWRGACLKTAINPNDEIFRQVAQRYGGDIVDLGQAAGCPKFNEFLETFSYFDRKGVPEHLSSGTALSRTIVTCAHVAKRFNPSCQVFLIGHSFGALMLERTFQNACIAKIITAWRLGKQEPSEDIETNPLPFDTVLLVNSAAPSIYAKQFQSFLRAAHALSRYEAASVNYPIFFSLTSSADWATGKTHYLANTFCFLLPTLKRKFRGDDLILASEKGIENVSIQQSYYYRHTPGHNPLLVNRFIEKLKTPTSDAQVAPDKQLRANLRNAGKEGVFGTSPRKAGGPSKQWRINFPPETPAFNKFSRYKAHGQTYRPLVWEKTGDIYADKDTGYWIIRCNEKIIKDHNDIWSQQAIETYAALFSISRALRAEAEQQLNTGAATTKIQA
jgi:hypothetical protein